MTVRSAQAARHWQLPEGQWQRTVIEAAEALGWCVWHPWTAIHSGAGWPDLFCVLERPGVPSRVLALELKGFTLSRGRSARPGHVTETQNAWLERLNRAGVLAVAAWPCDWPWVIELFR